MWTYAALAPCPPDARWIQSWNPRHAWSSLPLMYEIVSGPVSDRRITVRVMETAVTLREVRDGDLDVLYENQADPRRAPWRGSRHGIGMASSPTRRA